MATSAPFGRRAARLRWTCLGLCVVGLCLLPFVIFGGRVDRWIANVARATASPLTVAVFVVVLLALDTFLPVPSSILAALAAERLSFAGATVAIAAGLCLGCAVGYLVGRTAGSRLLARMVGTSELERARRLVTTRPGALGLAVTRAVPVLSESVMLVAGAARTPPARTAAICVAANVGLALAFAALGEAAEGPAALGVMGLSSCGIPVVATLLAAVAWPAWRRHGSQTDDQANPR